ncbi:MFS transporter [Candidatus Woesearchaeota archaeon]|nr:MFS transporter [Candidatus Woesearchaeota archaeon]
MANNDEQVKKSLKYSIIDGSFHSAMLGFGESFLSAFAVFLKATSMQLGLLSALPQLLGSLSQLYSNKLIKNFKSRKKVVCTFALLQGLMYLPIALVYFFGTLSIFHLIFFVSLYWIFGSILSPAWNSWMGDLVNEKERGIYFGRRNSITGLVSFIAFFIGGYLLERFSDGILMHYLGFATLFALALLSRIASFIYLTKKYEPPASIVEEDQFGFSEFLRHALSKNYGRFVFYLALMNFAVALPGPFFTPYMLKDLQFDYKMFTLVTATAMVIRFVSMPLWGKLCDKYGTKKILSATGFLMPLVPLLWVFSPNISYLILVEAYSGFVWAGFDTASFNFIFDSTLPQKRATSVAYYNILNGVTIFLGAISGSILVKYVDFFWSEYYSVFILSFILRYTASLIFVPTIKEVRKVEEISYRGLMIKVFTTMPARGIVHNIITFAHRKPKIKPKIV